MQHLKDYITESILSSVDAGKTAVIKKIITDKEFSRQNIAMLEKEVSVWKPKDKTELFGIIKAYIKSAGLKCSLNWIDVSNIEDLSYLFSNTKFDGDISDWDVSNVTDMIDMFYNSKFDKDISNWNIEHVKEKHSIFNRSKIQEKYKPLIK